MRGHLKRRRRASCARRIGGTACGAWAEGGARAPRSGHDAGALRADPRSRRREDRRPATTPASCPRRSRTTPRSRAPAPRIFATARRWRASSPGSMLILVPAGSMRSARRSSSRSSDATRESSRISASISISAAGPHGAVVHYRPTTASNIKLKPRSLYLIDFGAQYADGTTDVTRTIAIGTPSATMRRHYTLVLKAHIAIASCSVPQGHARAGHRPVRAPAAVGGGARFRPRNGPRRRQLPLGA